MRRVPYPPPTPPSCPINDHEHDSRVVAGGSGLGLERKNQRKNEYVSHVVFFLSHSLSLSISPQVRRVHAICFPGEAPTKTASTADEDADADGALKPRCRETNPEFWDRLTACHDEGDVLWFLLFRDDSRRDGKDAGEGEDEGAESGATQSLIGFAAAVPYAKSVYGMHLAVVPSQRGRGYGAWLMHEVWLAHLDTFGGTPSPEVDEYPPPDLMLCLPCCFITQSRRAPQNFGPRHIAFHHTRMAIQSF